MQARSSTTGKIDYFAAAAAAAAAQESDRRASEEEADYEHHRQEGGFSIVPTPSVAAGMIVVPEGLRQPKPKRTEPGNTGTRKKNASQEEMSKWKTMSRLNPAQAWTRTR